MKLAEAGAKAVAEQLDAQTPGHGLIGRPGEYMSYCNDGYGLLSEIVRRVGGEASFADYVKKNILWKWSAAAAITCGPDWMKTAPYYIRRRMAS